MPFFCSSAPAAQRLSASANRLGNQMQRDRLRPRLPSPVPHTCNHRTAPPHFVLLAAFCPGPAGPWLDHCLASFAPRMPDAIAMPSGVPLGCCPSRSLPWKDPTVLCLRQQTPHSHMCRDDRLEPRTPNLPRQSSPPPSRPNYVQYRYLPASLHAPVLHRVPASTSFHISPVHR